MSLSKENIQFIDTYLKNSDIQFIDVRMEMVDHVATAIEERMAQKNQSFYYAFKDYMVSNKRDLLSDYEKLKKRLQKKSFSLLWSELIKPRMFLLLAVSFGILVYFETLFSITFPHILFMWGLLICSIGTYAVAMLPKKKYRFSSLETLAWPLVLSTWVLHFLFNFNRAEPLFFKHVPVLINGIVAFFICLNTAYLITFFKMRSVFKNRFQYI